MTTMDKTSGKTLSFPADPEHAGLRLALFASFFGIWVGVYLLFTALVPADGINLLAGIVGFAAAALMSALVIEPLLKQRWPSGRMVTVNPDQIAITLHDQPQKTVSVHEPVSVLLWRFRIRHRRSRVPAGWNVLACALEQDDDYLCVYTLASPEQTEALGKLAHFTPLMSDKDPKVRDPRQDSLRVAGEQRRLRAAESHRWAGGAEISPTDFERFIVSINEQLAAWTLFSR